MHRLESGRFSLSTEKTGSQTTFLPRKQQQQQFNKAGERRNGGSGRTKRKKTKFDGETTQVLQREEREKNIFFVPHQLVTSNKFACVSPRQSVVVTPSRQDEALPVAAAPDRVRLRRHRQ